VEIHLLSKPNPQGFLDLLAHELPERNGRILQEVMRNASSTPNLDYRVAGLRFPQALFLKAANPE
jgi:hypothetical protein